MPLRLTNATPDILGRVLRIARRMWRSFNNACGIGATMIAILIASPAARAQESGADGLPSPDDVRAAFSTLRHWMDDFATPPMDDDACKVAIERGSGVCVILRRSGRVLGIGIDHSGDELMLRRAAGKAMNSVMADPALASLSAQLVRQERENPDRALTVDSLREDLGRTLSIELEVAGQLVPLIGRSIDQLARKLEPGLDGVALRQRQARELIFPSALRAANAAGAGDPAKLLLNLALKAGLSIKDFDKLAERQDIGLYSFRTITLMQPSPGDEPLPTFRGDVIVPLEAVSRSSIIALADGIARHITASMWPDPPAVAADPHGVAPQPAVREFPAREPLGIMGNYLVVADRYEPLIAPPLDQALAALALNRYASAIDRGVDAKSAAQAASTAALILNDLAVVAEAEDDPRDDVAACAAIVYAVAERPEVRQAPAIEQLFVEASKKVARTFEAGAGFVDRPVNGRSRNLAPPVQGMLAGAMARLLTMTGRVEGRADAAVVRQAIDAAWQSAPQPQHVALLPWIGWAESDFAAATGQPLAHLDDLRLLIGALHESRIGSSTHPASGANGDLIGGFALAGESTVTSTATAQSVRPAAWLASALADAKLIDPARAAEYRRGHLQTLRFLTQLTIRFDNMGTVRHPSRALGGLRDALWDTDQSVPAQALGLVAAVDTLACFSGFFKDGELP